MHLLFDEITSQGRRIFTGRPPPRSAQARAHWLASEKPCIVLAVLAPQGNIHGVFGCVVCMMMAHHLRLHRITTDDGA